MKKLNGFTNCQILTEEGLKKTSLRIEDGKIASIGDFEEGLTLNENYIVLPGFIDQHVHGAAGSDAMDGTIEDLQKIANALATEGTVGFLATTMTQSVENITKALVATKEYIEAGTIEGAEVLGVHLEGPFISLKHIGAQPLEYVAKPSVEVFKKYQEASGNNIKLVSLAVEEEGALELVSYLASNNVVASLGHTDATASSVEAAIKAGAKNVTHTFNAMKPLHHREIGTVGSALLYDELNCELICDGIHVSKPAINLIRKCKPLDKLTLVTDAMRAKHMPDGLWELGGQPVVVKSGEARLTDGTLAGSVLSMNKAVKNIMAFTGASLAEAVNYASLNPAINLGIDDKLGSIKVGKNASFAIVDENFDVVLTVKNGYVIYEKE